MASGKVWVRVAIRPDDTPETFEARMHDAENGIIGEAIGKKYLKRMWRNLRHRMKKG